MVSHSELQTEIFYVKIFLPKKAFSWTDSSMISTKVEENIPTNLRLCLKNCKCKSGRIRFDPWWDRDDHSLRPKSTNEKNNDHLRKIMIIETWKLNILNNHHLLIQNMFMRTLRNQFFKFLSQWILLIFILLKIRS